MEREPHGDNIAELMLMTSARMGWSLPKLFVFIEQIYLPAAQRIVVGGYEDTHEFIGRLYDTNAIVRVMQDYCGANGVKPSELVYFLTTKWVPLVEDMIAEHGRMNEVYMHRERLKFKEECYEKNLQN